MASKLSRAAVSKLTKVGEKLVTLPASTQEIIKRLVETEKILSTTPLCISTIKPLHVIYEALISKDLAGHSNMVVKISVACCICEIMRIMGPDTPYDDNQMEEFFKLVVTVFQKLSSSSGEDTKIIKVVETLSSGKLAVMMCHLQLDGLIERLFRQFLKAAELNSSDVVSKMEKIMTMIIKDSKEIPQKLVNLLATNAKNENKLAKKVLKNYADQLNPDNPDTIESVEHGESLVGRRIKVWWPEDETYYEGIVKIFEPRKKKHKVLYDDGEKERIDLRKEKWELVVDMSPTLDCAQSAEHGENLVGRKIQVWWPADKTYYKGVVKSFDRSKMKHKVLYDDGDVDVLDLNKRRWMLLEDVSASECT